jgi:hypothetical protein
MKEGSHENIFIKELESLNIRPEPKLLWAFRGYRHKIKVCTAKRMEVEFR